MCLCVYEKSPSKNCVHSRVQTVWFMPHTVLLRHRRMATQHYTWQLVSMVTPTRRIFCSCCCAEELIPASATWRTTSQPTCCRSGPGERRWAAPPLTGSQRAYSSVLLFQFNTILIYLFIFSSSSCWRNEVLRLVDALCPCRTRNDKKNMWPSFRGYEKLPLLRRGFKVYY